VLRGLESRPSLLHAPLRWRGPVPSHAQRRVPVGAYPQRSSWVVGHRPRTHRPQRCPLASANGASAPSCKPATPPKSGGRAANKRELRCPRSSRANDYGRLPLVRLQRVLVRNRIENALEGRLKGRASRASLARTGSATALRSHNQTRSLGRPKERASRASPARTGSATAPRSHSQTRSLGHPLRAEKAILSNLNMPQ
jgi:hypothetical protein